MPRPSFKQPRRRRRSARALTPRALKNNTTAFGGGAAAALALLSYVSLQYYRRGHLCKPATTASLAVALSAGGVFWRRYSATRQVAPSGALAALSAAMAVFYAWSLALGPAPGKRPPAAVAAAAAARKKAANGKE